MKTTIETVITDADVQKAIANAQQTIKNGCSVGEAVSSARNTIMTEVNARFCVERDMILTELMVPLQSVIVSMKDAQTGAVAGKR